MLAPGPLHPFLVFRFFRSLPFPLSSSNGLGSALWGDGHRGKAPRQAPPARLVQEAHCLSSRVAPRRLRHWALGVGLGVTSSLVAPFPPPPARPCGTGWPRPRRGLCPPFRYSSSYLLLSAPVPPLQAGTRIVRVGSLPTLVCVTTLCYARLKYLVSCQRDQNAHLEQPPPRGDGRQ